MKVFVITVLCAITARAAGGSIGWPGAVALSTPVAVASPVLKTVLPGKTKTTAYSTTQYINAIPASYQFGAHPQFPSFAPLPTGYYSFANQYLPNVYYPAQPALVSAFGPPSFVSGTFGPVFANPPLAPSAPAPINPSPPSQSPTPQLDQSAGDADSAVVDAIDATSQGQLGSGSQSSIGSQTSSQFSPSNIFSNFPSNSQISQGFAQNPSFPSQPSFPSIPSTYPTQIPQNPQNPQPEIPVFPSLPQLPQVQFPHIQFPLGSNPSLPNIPQFPQSPSLPAQIPQFPSGAQNPSVSQFPQDNLPHGPFQSPAASFPATSNQDVGLNDEDTISVESA